MFFFFKLKTAYDMRTSDWISDVCSSDLIIAPPPAPSSIRPPNTSQWECFSAYAEPPAGPSACPTAYNHPADEGRDHPGPGHILAKRCSSKTAMPVRGWRV